MGHRSAERRRDPRPRRLRSGSGGDTVAPAGEVSAGQGLGAELHSHRSHGTKKSDKSHIDLIIRVLAGATVILLACIAAISYSHMHELAIRHGETGSRAHAFPLSVDGIELTASLVLLAHRRAGTHSGLLPWVALGAGTLASLAINRRATHVLLRQPRSSNSRAASAQVVTMQPRRGARLEVRFLTPSPRYARSLPSSATRRLKRARAQLTRPQCKARIRRRK